MNIRKENIYAIPIENENRYVYFLCVGRYVEVGYVIKVFDYISDTLTPDIDMLSKMRSPFPTEYITAYFTREDKQNMYKVGKINLDYKNRSYQVVEKLSYSCSFGKLVDRCKLNIHFSEDSLEWDITDEEYDALIKECAKKQATVTCNDWRLVYYRSDSKGIFKDAEEVYVGTLPDEYKFCQMFGTAYLKDDIVEYVTTGMDRITAEALIYQ